MLTDILKKIQSGDSLSIKESESAFELFFKKSSDCQIAALLSLLSVKGETAEELAGLAQVIRSEMLPVRTSSPVLDIVGTGGDGSNTVNLSTGSALLAASCGASVAKHGNRAVSSKCGSAGVITALKIPLYHTALPVQKAIRKNGFAFMYAPYFHPLMARLAPIRAELGMRTCLNLVGPLLNPAMAEYAVIGVYAPSVVPVMAKIFSFLKVKRAFVFHGSGTDEITAMGAAKGYLVEEGQMTPFQVDPRDYNISPCSLQQLQGGDAELNAAILSRAFEGEQGAVFDSLALCAGVGLYISNCVPSIEKGVELSKEHMRSGKVASYLQKLRSVEGDHEK